MIKTEVVLELLRGMGEDPSREGLQRTPERVCRAWEFWTSGYNVDPTLLLSSFEDGAQGYDGLVFVGPTPLWSTCEHHLAPFWGNAYIGYLPDGRIVGLSKLARLVEVFSRRLQVQERLTYQIGDTLYTHLKPRGVAVVLQCRHTCMESRGICKQGIITSTSSMFGEFLSQADLRAEFFNLVQGSRHIV